MVSRLEFRSAVSSRKRLIQFWVIFMAILVPIAGHAQALVILDSVDYLSNIEATDRSIYPSSHPSTEVAPGRMLPAVYVRGTSPNAKLYFQEFFGNSFATTLHIVEARYATLGNNTHSISVSPGTQTVNLTGYPNKNEADMAISGLPSGVSGGTLEIKAYMTLNHQVTVGWTTYPAGTVVWGSGSNFVPVGKLLLTDSTPLGLQTKPWTDLLTLGCKWAEGESGPANVLAALTYNLFWNSGFLYTGGERNYSEESNPPGSYTYKLSGWFADANNGIPDNADCLDYAGALLCMAHSLGVSGTATKIEPVNEGLFYTNPLSPAGSNAKVWSSATYRRPSFLNHVVFVREGAVFDATAAHWRSLTGAIYQEPPMGWSLSGFWQTASSWTSPDEPPRNNGSTTWARLGFAYGIQFYNESQISTTSSVLALSAYN